MPQTINTNIVSLNAQRNLNASQSSLSTSMQRLSSGLRVNSAKDDAAGLAIAERMSSNVRGMNVAMRNANDAISMSQVAEGALGKIGDNLQRMRELAVQARNATNSTGDRVNLQKEFRQLQQEVERTVKGAKFNGKDLFTSTASTSLEFQVGSGTTDQDHITIQNFALDGAASLATSASVAAASYAASAADPAVIQQLMVTIVTEYDGSMGGLGIGGTNAGAATVPSMDMIDSSIDAIDRALDLINERRANFGAAQNRFEAVISNLQINVENQSAARGRIMDADFAVETSNMSRSQILQQAGTAMVAQANQLPQQVMQLLGR